MKKLIAEKLIELAFIIMPKMRDSEYLSDLMWRINRGLDE